MVRKLTAMMVGLGMVAAVGSQASAATVYPPRYGWHGGWHGGVVYRGGWGYGYHYGPPVVVHRVWVPGYWAVRPWGGRVWVEGCWR
jgi:hypothetical protein